MGLFDFLKRKKKEAEAAPGEVFSLDDVDPSVIDPPETRYTQEYQDFLASKEGESLPRGEMQTPPETEHQEEA
jgi:hypothetical protein